MAKRLSTVERHPQLEAINEALDNGASYRDVSAHYGLSLAAVGRHALSRRSTLDKLTDDTPNVSTVVFRALEAADHAQEVRRQTRVLGSPAAQARAISTELATLDKLVEQLGVHDTDVADALTDALALGNILIEHVRSDTHATDVLDRMAQIENLAPVAKTLRAQLAQQQDHNPQENKK